MASFNGARHLRSQLDSILPQLGRSDELIVSDDGSTDGSLEILAGLRDARVRVLRGPARGAAENFASALAQARNHVVFLADQDDVWEKDKLARQSAYLERYLLVVRDCVITDESGGVTHSSYFAINRSRPGLIRNLCRNSYMGCCMAFRRELLQAALPIPSKLAHDWWLGMVAELCGDVLFLPEPLVRYRRHGANISPTARKSDRSLRAKLGDRLTLAYELSKRAIKGPLSAGKSG
jgi:glycosyltransferase involved in cell wall biosynthesis